MQTQVTREGKGVNYQKIEKEVASYGPATWHHYDNTPKTGWKLVNGFVKHYSDNHMFILKGPDGINYSVNSKYLIPQIAIHGIQPGGELSFPLIWCVDYNELQLESFLDSERMNKYMTEDEREKIIKLEAKAAAEEAKLNKVQHNLSRGQTFYLSFDKYHYIYIGKVTDGNEVWHAFVMSPHFPGAQDSINKEHIVNNYRQINNLSGRLYKEIPEGTVDHISDSKYALPKEDLAKLMFDLCETWYISNKKFPKWTLGSRDQNAHFAGRNVVRFYEKINVKIDVRAWHQCNLQSNYYGRYRDFGEHDVALLYHPLKCC
jgi:hypothetical protein